MFTKLMTNPSPNPALFSPTEQRVRAYLGHVRSGNSQRPYCPFVGTVEIDNGYWWKDFSADPETFCLTVITGELCAEFWGRSPRPTTASQSLDTTTIVASFSHATCESPEFGRRLEAARNVLRLLVLNQGLMLAHMFSGHADPKGDGRYVSPIPLLMVRRMHEPDRVFMKVPREVAAYRRYFPGADE